MSISAADRPGRRLFLMGATYALGTFNDNFFKQAACLLALSFGLKEIQGAAGMFFALPFVLFSAWAGWLADRLSKSSIVVWAKGLEVLAMAVGAYGLITLDWHFILAMVAIMGLQSAIFSPALNGSIPETVSSSSVPKVNAALKLATTLTILAGIALAGVGLDQSWGQSALPPEISFGRVFVGAVALLAALLGLAAALFISPGPVKSRRPPVHFPWAGPFDSVCDCVHLHREPALGLTLLAEAYFYFASSLAVFLINDLGETELNFSFSQTSLLPAALMLGLCAGSLLAGRGSPLSWQKLLMPAGAGMGAGLLLSGLAPLFAPEIRLCWLIGAYLLTGFAGGVYLIPVTSFIQVRPCPFEKGRVLGISGFASFVGIVISGACYNLLTAYVQPSIGLIVAGAASLGAALLFGVGIRLIQAGRYGIDPSLKHNLNAVTLSASIFPSDKNTL